MLDANEQIDFTEELLQIVERLIADYERLKGPLDNDLKRGLAVSFVLGALQCNIDAIWDELARAPHFAAQHPRTIFESCEGKTPQITDENRRRIHTLLTRYGWMGD